MSQFEENRKKEFASVLRQLKENWKGAHGSLTDEDLAEALEVSRESVNRWMNGSSYPSKSKLSALADFFHVPVSFFSEKKDKPQGLTLTDESAHKVLEEQCEDDAARCGLSPDFVSFIKSDPALADLIVSLCWVNPEAQSFDPSVPEVPGNTFQIVSSSGIKVYPPHEVLLMLSLVQRDLTEYARFLVQKHGKVITDHYSGKAGSPSSRYWLEKKGMSGLSSIEEALVEMYRLHPDLPEAKKGERLRSLLANWDKTMNRIDAISDAVEKRLKGGKK